MDNYDRFIEVFIGYDIIDFYGVSRNSRNMDYTYILMEGQHIHSDVDIEEWLKFYEGE